MDFIALALLDSGFEVLILPLIILILAVVFKKLERDISGSAYWRERQSNYWLLLVLWSVFYFFFVFDCSIRPVFQSTTCSSINQGLFIIFSILALFASMQWFFMAQKRKEFLKKIEQGKVP